MYVQETKDYTELWPRLCYEEAGASDSAATTTPFSSSIFASSPF